MRIQNYRELMSLESRLFESVLADLAIRNLPDCGLYRTLNSGMRWNDAPLETMSAKHPSEEGRMYHFSVITNVVDGEGKLEVLLCSTKNGQLQFYQKWECDPTKIGNISFEVVKYFLEHQGFIKTDRQGIELMYPAYGLEVPPVPIYEKPEDRPKATYQTPLPEVPN